MFDLSQIFIAQAWAQDAAPVANAASGGASSMMGQITNFMPLILIFGVFYMLILRPQQKKMNEQAKMIQALKRGDRIITSGGIYGKVTSLQDDALMIEIADGVNIKIQRAQVQSLAAKPDTATIAADGMDEKKS